MHRVLFVVACMASSLVAQNSIPDWCRALPRPEYKSLERVTVSDPWFEVYKPAQGFAGAASEEVRAVMMIVHIRERSATGLLLQISNPALDQGLPVRLVKKMPS